VSSPTTFGLFGTLVRVRPPVDRPRPSQGERPVPPVADPAPGRDGGSSRDSDRGRDWDPAAAVADELEARGVEVPEDWAAAYAEPHLDPPPLAGVPLPAHVGATLRSRGVEWSGNAVRRAVVAAFDPEVEVRTGAVAAVEAAAERGPVGVLTNCVVPELAGRTLLRAGLRDWVDGTVTAAGCGWRKPHDGAFRAVAKRLDVEPAELVHVGGTDADAGVTRVDGRFLDTRETPLAAVARTLADGP
jgi:FMN phosphatase YigB (HAD superfamily)